MTVYLVFSAILLTACLLTWLASKQDQKTMVNLLKDQLDDLRAQQSELLNRIQAADLKSFVALQNNSKSGLEVLNPVDVFPRTDAGELARMAELYGEATGLGEEIILDDFETEMFATIPGFNLDSEI